MAEVPSTAPTIQNSDAQGALAEFVNRLYKAASRARWAEEREWATAGYFDQLKQWLDEDPQAGNKLRPMSKKKDNKWPMPVTNLFSKTIASNANALGADIPRMLATSDNYDGRNRRAAEAAENCIDAANRESGMEVLNPRLARMVPLWGLGCTYDTIAFDHSTVEVPQIQASPVDPAGTDVAQPGQPGGGGQPNATTNPGQPSQAASQPGSVSPDTAPDTAAQPSAADNADASALGQTQGIQAVPTARLKTLLLTPFEYFLPRDAQDPNLAEWKIVRWRRPLGEVKENYPDYADKLTKDEDDANLAFYYLNTLRSLSYQNSKSNEQEEDHCTLMEFWSDWTSLPEEVQKKIAGEWQSQPSEIYADQGFTKLQAAVEYGLFCVIWQNQIVQWAENPWDGDCSLTFFPWQKDVVSVYPKGLSVELIPLTKSLNRVDSLMLRAVMSNGTVKLLWPTSQTTPPPSGDPVELAQWDPIGDGKVKPEYFSGHAYGPELIKLREQIVSDINELGFNNSVAEGEMPGSGTAFRALAYLGSKAEETRKTQRYLWEQAHELRGRKIVKMARKIWTEPRKIQTAGFNNRYGSIELDVADLDGGYEITVIQDSSKPKTMTEKLQALQMAQQGGYVNPQDPSTRDFVLDALGLNDLDPSDHLQYEKAERDLQKLIQGIQPMESPFEKWDIPLKVLADYTLTEEFENLPAPARNGILMYAQYVSEKLQVAQGAPLGAPALPPPGPQQPGPAGPSHPPGRGPAPSAKAGPGGQSASHVLGQVPGATVSAPQVEGAAIQEAASVVPNSPSPTA